MIHDSASCTQQQLPAVSPEHTINLLCATTRQLVNSQQRGRGRPAVLSWSHLCLALLVCCLRGCRAQLDIWRSVCGETLGCFSPVAVTDQAIYNRLAHAAEPMRQFFEQISWQMRSQLEGWQDQRLAPFATQVLVLDESCLDPRARWLAPLRDKKAGDTTLLGGRLSALFDIRLQQWVRVDWLPEGKRNSKEHAPAMLEGLTPGTLLLMDRGYLSFALFDQLTQQQIWWVSRYANKVSMQHLHTYYQGDGVFDGLVYLGTHRANQAKEVVRLVSFRHRQRLYRYFTNVLDPRQLSLQEVVKLYARRWDIEGAFRVLKDHLGVNTLWSAKSSVIEVQLWSTLLLAQCLHRLQVQIAMQEGVDIFDVSLALLIGWMPRWLAQGINPVTCLARIGRDLGFIRPSTRSHVQVPCVDPRWITFPEPEGIHPREQGHYSRRHCEQRSSNPEKKADTKASAPSH